MKRCGIIIAAAALLYAAPASCGDSLCAGAQAPTFYLPCLDGSKFFLSHQIAPKGHKILLVDFFATWCVPCRRELPLLVELAEKHAADSVLLVVIDVGENADTVRTWVSAMNWERPVLLDRYKAVSGKYGVKTLPSLFIIDRNGAVRYHSTNFDEKTGVSGAVAVLDSLTGPRLHLSPSSSQGSANRSQNRKKP